MEPEYPPCPKRVTAADRHPTCGNHTNRRFQWPVPPLECRRCLGLEPEGRPGTTEATIQPPQPRPRSPEATEAPEPPGLVRRAISYTEALARWTAAGRPERADKEVERIFHQYCKTCKWYDRKKQICRGCGCRVAENGYAVLNKIKMATENCPRELW